MREITKEELEQTINPCFRYEMTDVDDKEQQTEKLICWLLTERSKLRAQHRDEEARRNIAQNKMLDLEDRCFDLTEQINRLLKINMSGTVLEIQHRNVA